MSDKAKFQEILRGVRSDLKYLDETLLSILLKKIMDKNYEIDAEIRNWIFDVFLDKLYEIHFKMTRIFEDFGLKTHLPMFTIRFYAEQIATERTILPELELDELTTKLLNAIEKYEKEVETTMSTIRSHMHKTNWMKMKQMKTEDYVLPVKRAKYVKARDELEKAKQAVKAKKWDEVLNHLRPAIDLAIKEKFGFKKIFPMKQFLLDAEKHNLPLPSYTLLYDYFDEGSHRLHDGKLNTPLECEEALNFVAKFIDRLDLIDISQKEIEEFKKKSNAVD